MAPSHLTLSDLGKSNSRSPRFGRLISHAGALILLYVTIKHLQETIYGPTVQCIFIFALEWPGQVKVKVNQTLSGRRTVWYTYICKEFTAILIWMPQRIILLAGGVSAVPAVFLVNCLRYSAVQHSLVLFTVAFHTNLHDLLVLCYCSMYSDLCELHSTLRA